MSTVPPADRPVLLTTVTAICVGTYGLCVLAVLARSTSLDHPAAAVLSLVVGAVALAPLAWAFHRRSGPALADPLVLAGWLFWLPMFCLGGVSLALGWSTPYFLDLLADPSAALAAAQLWALVGFAALAAGSCAPGLARAGAAASRRLPRGDWAPGASRWPASILLVAGLAISAYALATDALGYAATTRQQLSPIPAYLQTIALVGAVLLWFDLLRSPAASRRRRVATAVGLGGAALVGAGLAESRATLATWVLAILLVTALAEVAIPRRLAAGVLAVAAAALVLGVLVGSTYRELRAEGGATAAQPAGAPAASRTDDLRGAFGRIGERGAGNLGYLRDRSVQRLEAPGALAVVVARQQELDGTDRAAGAPRVLESVVGSFIPRVVWSDKPASTDPGAISRLYFEFEANAFASTPMGDLLRDLGPLAVPVAMAAMGAVLRLLHAALLGDGSAPAGRVVAFVVLIVRAPMWWEGFYATFLADLVRAGMVIAVALAFVEVWARAAGRRSALASGPAPGRAAGDAPRLLVVSQYWAPAELAGGARSTGRAIDALCGEVEAWVLAGDRDVGDPEPWPDLPATWVERDGVHVWAQPWDGGAGGRLRAAIDEVRPDAIYLPSLFAPGSLAVWRHRIARAPMPAVVVAPEGELHPGALAHHTWRKRAVLGLLRATGALRSVHWRAADELEAEQIRTAAGRRAQVSIAPDLHDPPDASRAPVRSATKEPGRARVAFVGTIVPKKGLHRALELLWPMRHEVDLDVYGPVGSAHEWARCEAVLDRCEPEVRWTAHGPLPHAEVASRLADADLLILPTLGENYGYVIAEALEAGCPVLISDRTPWRGLAEHRCGWDLPLDDLQAWRRRVSAVVGWDEEDRQRAGDAARRRAASERADGRAAAAAWLALVHGALPAAPTTTPVPA